MTRPKLIAVKLTKPEIETLVNLLDKESNRKGFHQYYTNAIKDLRTIFRSKLK